MIYLSDLFSIFALCFNMYHVHILFLLFCFVLLSGPIKMCLSTCWSVRGAKLNRTSRK